MIDAGPAADEGRPARTTAVALARAGLIVSSTVLVARILGYVRTVVIGTSFGTGPDLDAFFAAFRIPDLIFQLVAAGAVASALVPLVSGLLATGGRARAWRVVATIANLMLVGLVGLGIVAFVAAEPLVRFITPGFDGVELARTVELTRIMLLAPVALALGAVATSALNADRRFGASAVAPVVYNVVIIAGALLLSGPFGITGLAIAVVAAAVGQVAVQVPALLKMGYRHTLRIDLSDEEARQALLLMGPRVLGLGATQITFVVMTSLASGLGPGAISAYSIAYLLLQIPLGVIGIPLGIVIFPSLSEEAAVGRTESYLELLTRGVRILIFVMLPITALGVVLSRHVVELLLGYGRFGQAAVDLTAQTLLLFLLGLTAHATIGVMARAFYATRDTRTPVAAAILAVVINTSLGAILVGPLGLPALGLAIATAAWIEAVVLLWLLVRRTPGLDVGALARHLATCALAAIAAAGVAFLLLQAMGPDVATARAPKLAILAAAALASVAGGVAYLAIARAVHVAELPILWGISRQLVQRRRPA